LPVRLHRRPDFGLPDEQLCERLDAKQCGVALEELVEQVFRRMVVDRGRCEEVKVDVDDTLRADKSLIN